MVVRLYYTKRESDSWDILMLHAVLVCFHGQNYHDNGNLLKTGIIFVYLISLLNYVIELHIFCVANLSGYL